MVVLAGRSRRYANIFVQLSWKRALCNYVWSDILTRAVPRSPRIAGPANGFLSDEEMTSAIMSELSIKVAQNMLPK